MNIILFKANNTICKLNTFNKVLIFIFENNIGYWGFTCIRRSS